MPGDNRESVLAKLYFSYSTMNAGKSTLLLQASYNYRERGMRTVLFIAAFDDRAGVGRIASRIGLDSEAHTFRPEDDLYETLKRLQADGDIVARLPVRVTMAAEETRVFVP